MKSEAEQRAFEQGIDDFLDGWLAPRARQLYDERELIEAYDRGYYQEQTENEYVGYLIDY